MGKAQVAIDKVINYFDQARKLHPEITTDLLDDSGEIWYANGNDGTEFDWWENGHTCEFMIFYKKSQLGFIKAFVSDKGEIFGWLYLDEGKAKPKKLPVQKMSIEEAEALVDTLYREADPPFDWAMKVSDMDFSTDSDIPYVTEPNLLL